MRLWIRPLLDFHHALVAVGGGNDCSHVLLSLRKKKGSERIRCPQTRSLIIFARMSAALYACSAALACVLFGCGTRRRYGFRVFQPPGNFSFAASSLNDGTRITSSPSFQFTGVATL